MGQGPGEPADRDSLHPHADQRNSVPARIDPVIPVGQSPGDIAQSTGKQAIAEGRQIGYSALRQMCGEATADADRPYRKGQTGFLIGFEEDAAQRRFALGDLRALAGHLGDELKDRRAFLHTNHGVVIAAHSGIGLVGGAAWKDLVVGGRYMAVRPEDGRDAAIGKMTERHLFARGLGVKIDEDRRGLDAEVEFGEELFEPGEGVIERIHEEPAHQVDDENAPLADRMQPPAGTGGSLREVRRAQDAGIALDIGDDFALVPDVIAGGQDIDFGVVKFAAEAFGQAAAGRRVLGIDDDQVEGEPTAQGRHVLFYGLTAGPSDNIATKQDFHTGPRAGDSLRSGAGSAVGVQLLRGPP